MTNKSISVLITGGSGFIGSHLAEVFINKSDCAKVVVVDNLVTGDTENLNEIRDSKKFDFIKCDINELNEVDFKEYSFDYIFNFASIASPKIYSEKSIETLKTGSIGVLNVLELAKTHNARLIHASTSEIYGDPLIHPQVETYYGNVNSVGPRSMYDEAKRFAEAIITAYGDKYNLSYLLVRIFNTYGPKMGKGDGRVIPNFITAALCNQDLELYGNGLQTRSLCYVDDLIDGLIKLMDSDFVGPVNLGNPSEITVLALAKLIIEILQSKSKIVSLQELIDDPKRRCPDISLVRRLVDWEPKMKLEDGIINTAEYFKHKL